MVALGLGLNALSEFNDLSLVSLITASLLVLTGSRHSLVSVKGRKQQHCWKGKSDHHHQPQVVLCETIAMASDHQPAPRSLSLAHGGVGDVVPCLLASWLCALSLLIWCQASIHASSCPSCSPVSPS